ncbi:hypothetical protein D3C85_1349630 [compost metagenome]
MGYGPMAGVIQQAASEHPNIFYHPAVSPDVLPAYTASADVGLCLIENLCLSYYYCLPNKLFEYLMAGLPVLVSDLQELRRFVQEHPVGQIVLQSDSTAIREAVMAMDDAAIDSHTQAALEARTQFHWQAQERVLLEVYAQVGLRHQDQAR